MLQNKRKEKRERKSKHPKEQGTGLRKKKKKRKRRKRKIPKKFHEEALGTQHKREKKEKKVGDSVINIFLSIYLYVFLSIQFEYQSFIIYILLYSILRIVFSIIQFIRLLQCSSVVPVLYVLFQVCIYLLLSSGPAGGEILGLTPRYPWLALTFFYSYLYLLIYFFFLLPSLIIPFGFPVCEWILLNMEIVHSYFSLNCIPPITPNRLCGPMIASAVKGLPCQLKRNRFLWLKIGYRSVAGKLGLSFAPIV